MIPESKAQDKSGSSWNRWVVLLLLVLLSAATISRIRPIEPGLEKLLKSVLPKATSGSFSRAVRDFQKVSKDFGFQRIVLIGLVAPKGKNALSPMMIEANRLLSERLKVLTEVQSVLSLATTPTIKGGGNGLDVRDIFPPKHKKYTPADQQRLKAALLKDPLLVGNLLSTDARATLVLCTFQENKNNAGMKALLRVLRDVRRKYPNITAGVNGVPAVQSLLPSAMKRRPAFFIVLSLLLLLLVIVARLRDPRVLLWSLMTAVFASILGAVLILLLLDNSPGGLVMMGLTATSLALSWASTAKAGELVSPMHYLRSASLPWVWLAVALALTVVGLFAAWHMLVVMGVSVILGWVAALLTGTLARLRPFRTEVLEQETAIWNWGRSLSAMAAAIVIFALGASSLSSGRDVSSYIPGPKLLKEGHRILDTHFGGATPLLLYFQGNLRNPVHLKAIDRLGRRLESHANIQGPQSIAFLIRHLNYLMTGTPRVPDTTGKISAMWSLMDGQAALKSLVRERGKAGILQARIVLGQRWRQGCGGRPWNPACARHKPDALVKKINQWMSDLPLKSKTLLWSKANAKERAQLVQQRAVWVAEGLGLWWHRNTGLWLKQKRTSLEKRLHSAIKAWSEGKDLPSLSQKNWKKLLVPYLKSEDCDLELNKEQQGLVLKALLAAFADKSFVLTRPKVRAVLTKALEGTEPGKDNGGLKYAAKSIVLKGKEATRTLQLDAWARDTKAWFWKQTSAELRSALNKKWTLKSLLRAEFRAELMEMQNVHWTLLHQGQKKLEARHSGLHKLLMPVAALGRTVSLPLPWLFLLFFWLIALAMSRSLKDSLIRYWPVLCVTLVLLGVAGLLDWPLDPGLLVALVIAQMFSAQLSWSTSLRLPQMTVALLVFLPAVALIFTEIPLLNQMGSLLGFGVVFATLLHRWLRPADS